LGYAKNYFNAETFSEKLIQRGFIIDTLKLLMKSKLSAKIAKKGINVLDWSRLFNFYSFKMYPLTVIFDLFSSFQKGVIFAVYACK